MTMMTYSPDINLVYQTIDGINGRFYNKVFAFDTPESMLADIKTAKEFPKKWNKKTECYEEWGFQVGIQVSVSVAGFEPTTVKWFWFDRKNNQWTYGQFGHGTHFHIGKIMTYGHDLNESFYNDHMGDQSQIAPIAERRPPMPSPSDQFILYPNGKLKELSPEVKQEIIILDENLKEFHPANGGPDGNHLDRVFGYFNQLREDILQIKIQKDICYSA